MQNNLPCGRRRHRQHYKFGLLQILVDGADGANMPYERLYLKELSHSAHALIPVKPVLRRSDPVAAGSMQKSRLSSA